MMRGSGEAASALKSSKVEKMAARELLLLPPSPIHSDPPLLTNAYHATESFAIALGKQALRQPRPRKSHGLIQH
jgi:hypothetical protein